MLPFARALHDLDHTHRFFIAGRQVTKSTTIAFTQLVDSFTRPHFMNLFVMPSQNQTSKYSNQRLSPLLRDCKLSEIFADSIVTDNVFEKQFNNGAIINLSYAKESADRIRGLSTDRICLDELQDINLDVIPVIEQCNRWSPYKEYIYSGTPKTLDNPMEYYWTRATQMEWIIQCEHCGKRQNISTKNIQTPEHMSCKYCGKDIHAENGEWAKIQEGVNDFVGFHLPQPIVPEPFGDWKSVFDEWMKVQAGEVKESTFMNEVMGRSADFGEKPITLAQLRKLCNEEFSMPDKFRRKLEEKVPKLFAGIDWGVPGGNSRTCIVVAGRNNLGKFQVVYAKRYGGSNILEHIDDITQVIERYRCTYAMADYGVGGSNNLILKNRLGPERIAQCFYSGNQKQVLNYNTKSDVYIYSKTQSLNILYNLFYQRKVVFPKYAEVRDMFNDILNVTIEESRDGSSIRYIKVQDTTDDLLHAMNYCLLAASMVYGDVKVHDYVRLNDIE